MSSSSTVDDNFDYTEFVLEKLELHALGLTTDELADKLPEHASEEELAVEIERLQDRTEIRSVGSRWRV